MQKVSEKNTQILVNKLFVANKPSFISSNFFLTKLKRKYGIKKGGFSGTLDPFASGVLVVAFGKYTKLFRFLELEPKKYIATLFLGAKSLGFDTENITEVKTIPKYKISEINKAVLSMKNITHQIPPNFSAKWVNGKRAYELARQNKEFELQKVLVKIYDIKLLNYSHPFITFETVVSKGTYIRSLARDIAKELNTFGSLSMLKRVQEGQFFYNNDKELNPYPFINLKGNRFFGNKEDLIKGKKLKLDDFNKKEGGIYKLKENGFLSIVEIKDKKVSYLINQMEM